MTQQEGRGRRRSREERQHQQQQQQQQQQHDESDDGSNDKDNDNDNDKEGMLLMHKSGLTEDERRQIRRDQRALRRKLEAGSSLIGTGSSAAAAAAGSGSDDDDDDNHNNNNNDDDGDIIEAGRRENNRIYKKVRYTREAVLDGENMIVLANKAAQKVDRLIQVPRYDADRLVHKLVEKVHAESTSSTRSSSFDWEVLGEAAGVCFNALPSQVAFLNGPLQMDAPPSLWSRRKANLLLQQQQKKRTAEEELEYQQERNAQKERPQDVQGHTERNDNQLSAIEKSMQDMQKHLKKQVKTRYAATKDHLLLHQTTHDDDDGNNHNNNNNKTQKENIPKDVYKKFKKFGYELDAIPFLFNPKSFTQTVENMFHYSFLIKKATATIALREKGFDASQTTSTTTTTENQQQQEQQEHCKVSTQPGLTLRYVDDAGDQDKPPARQAIFTLTMQDYRDLLEAYDVANYQEMTGEGLPHRTIHKDAFAQSMSEAK